MPLFRPAASLLLAMAGLAACDHGSSTQPQTDPRHYTIAVQGGDRQFGAANAQLPDPLQVVVIDTRSSEPVSGVTVTWRIVTSAGTGAVLTTMSSQTDATGVASTQFKLGQALGDYVVEATFTGNMGSAASLRTTAVVAPEITSFTPASARAGDTLVITGRNFSPRAADDIVLFSGIRAAVASATDTQLRVIVPLCLPSRTVTLSVSLGAMTGNSRTLDVTGIPVTTLQLDVGQVRSFSDPSALACVRLPAGPVGATYLVVTQNATEVAGRTMPFQLSGITGAIAVASQPTATLGEAPGLDHTAFGSVAVAFEASMRTRELGFTTRSRQLSIASSGASAPPAVGARRTFNVINKDDRFTKVTAEIKAITAHAIIYEDLNTPAGGFNAADYTRFGTVFDDPIYATDVAVFGQPSDIDQNGKVIALFTPVVNELTSRSENSFIAGFFFGCDLVDSKSCNGTNTGEIFYSLVPDTAAKFSMRHSKDEVFRTVQPVLGHELMHMIQFNQRVLVGGAATQESLWLAEGLAHMAEDTLGGVFLSRGDTALAFTFRRQNFARAFMYLRAPAHFTLLSYVAPGTLEQRGAAWLFVRYLTGRFGNDILGRLARSAASSTTNVTAEARTSWQILINDWTVAMYADDAPELQGVMVDRRYTYPDIDLRRVLGQPSIAGSLGYPLKPTPYGFVDFTLTDTLAAAAASYIQVQSALGARELGLNLGGVKGLSFPTEARPQIAVMRLR